MIKELANTKKVGILLNENKLSNSDLNSLITALDIFTINNKEIFFYLFTNDIKIKSLLKKGNSNILYENINPSTYSDYKKMSSLGISFLLDFNPSNYYKNLVSENNKLNNKNEALKRGMFFSNDNGIILINDFNADFNNITEIEDSLISSLNLYKKIKKRSKDEQKLRISYLSLGNLINPEVNKMLSKLYEYEGSISFKDLFTTRSNFVITDSNSLAIFNEIIEGLNEMESESKEKNNKKKSISEYFSRLVFSYQKQNNDDINALLLKISLVFNFDYLLFLIPTNLKSSEYAMIFQLIKNLF